MAMDAPAADDAPAVLPRTRPGGRAARTRAREFAVQALYQHLVGRQDAACIDQYTRGLTGFHKADSVHFDALLHGCIAEADALDALLAPRLDRPLAQLSPVEHAVLWIGAWELKHAPEVPWRVVINEAVELAKQFGGTDGHKYVNGVLGALAPQLRPVEVEADRRARPAAAPAAPAPAGPSIPARKHVSVRPRSRGTPGPA